MRTGGREIHAGPARPPRPPVRRTSCRLLSLSLALALSPAGSLAGPTTTIDVRTLTGGGLTGQVVTHTGFGVVVVSDNTPYVFAWEELEPGAAFKARRDLLALERGGDRRLTAADHFQLGVYALSRDLSAPALRAFKDAERLDPSYAARAAEARAAHRAARDTTDPRPVLEAEPPEPEGDAPAHTPLAELVGAALSGQLSPGPPDEAARARVRAVYDRFGAMVVAEMGAGVSLLETPHFLIWTDWDRSTRERIGVWSEAMYAALCEAFHLDPNTDVFLARCPVFCWKNKARFQRFARVFDGHDGRGAVGYTRSIERSGHVHMVLYLQGRAPADLEAFGATLVHEGTHAFVHRLHSTRLIPHWVNEGLAELTSERVLGDGSPAGEKAALLAEQYVRHRWPVGQLVGRAGPIGVHEYPLAASLVTYLVSLGEERFARFMAALKDGRTLPESLAAAYDGMNLDTLEAGWRAWVEASLPPVEADGASR